jgi:hypothetical protein
MKKIQTKNYQYINLPNLDKISEEIFKKLPVETVAPKTGFVKVYPTEFFDTKTFRDAINKITSWDNIHAIALASTKRHSFLPIHTDYHDITTRETVYALNIPIYNCDNTYVIFYRLINENILVKPEYQNHGPGEDYCKYNASDVKEIEKFYLKTAAFFNTQVPHSVVNNTNESRIVLSIRFKSKLEIFKDFINE